jgi:chromosome segregation ATPase
MSTELEINPNTPLDTETPTPRNVNNSDAIENARQQERAKLYKKIEAEEAKAKKAEDDAKELASRIKELEKFKEEKEAENLSELDKLKKQLETANKQIANAEAAAKEKDAKLAEINRLIALKTFRDKIIRASGLDPDFEDSVYGDSEEELENSLKDALEKVERIKAKYSTPVESPRTPKPNRPPTPTPVENEVIDLDAVTDMAELRAIKKKLGL